jgi:hypothetical protein
MKKKRVYLERSSPDANLKAPVKKELEFYETHIYIGLGFLFTYLNFD